MSTPTVEVPRNGTPSAKQAPAAPPAERKPLTKKEIAADHPTWCPGCGDFSVLALYFKLIERRKLWQEKITTISGIGCSAVSPILCKATAPITFTGVRWPLRAAFRFLAPICMFLYLGETGTCFPLAATISTMQRARTSR
jgi:2-oxoglutarate ferredoxin oxidoreductase subunit beta